MTESTSVSADDQSMVSPNTKAMVARLNDARDIGANSLAQLNEQSEAMDRIHSLNTEHTYTLQEADRNMQKLSIRGRISLLFNKKPKLKKDKKTEKEPQKESSDDLAQEHPPAKPPTPPHEQLTQEELIWHPEKRPQYSGEHDPEILAGMTEEERKMVEEQDSDLDTMSSLLKDLKQISIRTNAELGTQSKKIDDLHAQVDVNSSALQSVNKKLDHRLR